MVGNKADLEEQRIVTPAFAHEKQRELGCEFYTETSSWTDLASIKELFQRICKELVRQKLYSTRTGGAALQK